MKYLYTLLFLSSFILIRPILAEDDHSLIPHDIQNYIGYGAIVAMLILFVIIMFVLLRTFKLLTKIILKSEGDKENIEVAHSKEPNPARFRQLVYSAAAAVLLYCLVYYIFNNRSSQNEQLQITSKGGVTPKQDLINTPIISVNENTVTLTTAAAVLDSGKVVFIQYCSACHGAQGQGLVGPNLADDYWLYGGKINDVFKTIKNGVPAKAMPTWDKQLSPLQISNVANYVKSLKGTNPPNAKAAQGLKEL